MIRTDYRNASVGDGVMRRKSLVECAGSLSEHDVPSRGSIPKSKSSSHIEFYTRAEQTKGNVSESLSPFRLGGRKPCRKRRDARTVKSEAAYVSPPKPERVRSLGKGAFYTNQSPTSASDIEAFASSPEMEGSDKLSLAIQDTLDLALLADTSRGTPLQSSASFSDEETIDLSIEEFGSIPRYCRLSSSNMSVPSDLSGSMATLDFHFTPPKRQGSSRRHLMARPLRSDSMAAGSVDCTPLPPTRRGSGRTTSTSAMDETVVPPPTQIHCSLDASPSKPARRTSMSSAADLEQSVSTFHTSLADSAPTKPHRNHSGMGTSDSTSSLDTSPLKPQRQSSTRFIGARIQRTTSRCDSLVRGGGIPMDRRRSNSIAEEFPDLNRHEPTLLARTFSGSGDVLPPLKRHVGGPPTAGPPRRTISRSESMARPRMPTLVRRDSITDAMESRRRSSSIPMDNNAPVLVHDE